MNKFVATVQVKLVIEAKNETDVEDILSGMNYDFFDPRVGRDDRMDSEIQSWQISEIR